MPRDNDPCENLTPLPSDADAYAAADERFELDEEHEHTLRWAPRNGRDIPISDEDWEAGLEEIRQAQQRYRDILERLTT